jgi:acyl dehydratase
MIRIETGCTGPSSECRRGQDRRTGSQATAPAGGGTCHAGGPVEIAVNNGHNRAPHGNPLAAIPVMTLTYEDFPPGHFGSFGPRHVTREEMLAFAAEFDPQPMHLDEAAASRSMLKGLAGSGWHLCSIMMRMMFDGYIGRTASLGSPGVSELRWLAPFRPGDDLMLDVDVTEARLSRSRPATGIVTFKCSVRNAAGQPLCEMVSPIIVQRRAPATAEQAR